MVLLLTFLLIHHCVFMIIIFCLICFNYYLCFIVYHWSFLMYCIFNFSIDIFISYLFIYFFIIDITMNTIIIVFYQYCCYYYYYSYLYYHCFYYHNDYHYMFSLQHLSFLLLLLFLNIYYYIYIYNDKSLVFMNHWKIFKSTNCEFRGSRSWTQVCWCWVGWLQAPGPQRLFHAQLCRCWLCVRQCCRMFSHDWFGLAKGYLLEVNVPVPPDTCSMD